MPVKGIEFENIKKEKIRAKFEDVDGMATKNGRYFIHTKNSTGQSIEQLDVKEFIGTLELWAKYLRGEL